MQLLLLLVSLANTALLVAVAGSLYKMLNRQQAGEADAKQPARPVVSDTPVPRQPNYGDIMAMQPPSTDLKLLKDI